MIGTDILLYSCCMVFYARDYIFDDDQLDRKHPIQLGFFTILRILRIMIDLYIGFQMVLFILFFLKQQRKTMKAKGREISCQTKIIVSWIFFLLISYQVNKVIRMVLSIASNYLSHKKKTELHNMEELNDIMRFYLMPLTDLFIGFTFLYFAYFQMQNTKEKSIHSSNASGRKVISFSGLQGRMSQGSNHKNLKNSKLSNFGYDRTSSVGSQEDLVKVSSGDMDELSSIH